MPLKTNVPAETLIANLEERIPQLMERANVVGLSIAAIQNAKLLWTKGFGLKSRTTKEPVDTQTVFEAASLSKPVFAYVALKLCETGILGLDTPLTESLPSPYIKDEPRLELITMRHVLSHTPGFPNWRPEGKPLEIHFTPGEKFCYSGEGYVYLQRVIEHLTGQSLADYMKVNLFEPFGMHRSSYVWMEPYEADAAQPHDKEGNPKEKWKPSQAISASSLHTTPTDFAKFLIEFIQPSKIGAFHLTPDLRAEMLRPQVLPIQGNKRLSWGLGWGIQLGKCGDSFWHWGSNNDVFKAFTVAFLEQRMGVVIMTNSSNGLKICEEIVDQSIGGEHPAFSDYLEI